MFKKSIVAFMVAGLLVQALPAQAYWGRGWRRGYYVHHLGPGYFALTVAGLSYLFYEGLFYRYTPVGYMIAEPPVGAVVPVLPPGYTTVMVQRTPYFYYNSIYYLPVPGGYTVVEPPASAPQPAIPPQAAAVPSAPASPQATPTSAADTFDIYVPNQDGSYTLVTLKKTDKGFVGPQGEFYPEHPTVEKLKVLYGKKAESSPAASEKTGGKP